ncbi:MAG: putative serine/threonine protein kinase, partial [Streblomastix strix]
MPSGKNIILLEFCNFDSLNDIFMNKKSGVSESYLKIIMWQIINGVDSIHSVGLMHRDLKAENILLHNIEGTENVILKISDFGLAKEFKSLEDGQSAMERNMQMTSCGTPLNMAPEVLSGIGIIDSKIDIWSVGVIMYQLITKRYPFESPNLEALINQTKIRIDRPLHFMGRGQRKHIMNYNNQYNEEFGINQLGTG